jgi:tetratricopeptide (TPR) repeat protein
MEMFLNKQVRVDSPLMKNTYGNFETNLRDIIAVAHSSGARVIVSTVATNLKDCAPFASMHRENLGRDALRSWSELVQQGSELENGGLPADALRMYLSATEIDNQYAELEFRIARCLSMLGDYQSAKAHYVRARDLDTLRFRADSKLNEITRSVALSSGAELVDADAIFANGSSNGIAGSDLFYEHVHMTPEGNYLLARSVFLQIVSKIAPAAPGSIQDEAVPSQSVCNRLLALTSHDRAYIGADMLQRANRPPFTTQLNHSEQVWRFNFMATAGQETPDQTASQYQWAIAQRPDDWMLHYNYGRFFLSFDRAAAIEQFRIARPWDGAPMVTPDDGKPVN